MTAVRPSGRLDQYRLLVTVNLELLMTIYGALAMANGVKLPVQVLRSAAGFYLGTVDDEGPYSRESVEYWPNHEGAEQALASGNWQQRARP